MPRPENPRAHAKKERQARYRRKLTAMGRPEASEVDVALAAAAAAYADSAARVPADGGSFGIAMKALLRGAVDVLVHRGHSRTEAEAMLRRRVSRDYRDDLAAIVAASGMPKRIGIST